MGTAAERKNERIIAALISTPTVKAASEACGVSTRQIYKRLEEPEFRAAYDKARHDLLDKSTAALQGHLSAAVETMGEIVNDPKAAPQTRLNAAEAIVRNTLKLTEQGDILARLDALEKAQQ